MRIKGFEGMHTDERFSLFFPASFHFCYLASTFPLDFLFFDLKATREKNKE